MRLPLALVAAATLSFASRVAVAQSPASAAASPAPPPPPPAPPPILPPPVARAHAEGSLAPAAVIHIFAGPGVFLEVMSPQTSEWAPVCEAPCDRALPLGPVYRIGGPALRPSGPLALSPPAAGPLKLRVDPASKTVRSVGVGLLIGGGVTVPASLLSILAGALLFAPSIDNSDTSQGAAFSVGVGLFAIGVISLPIGAVSLLTGGIMVLATPSPTRATQVALGAPAPGSPATEGPRAPTWRSASTEGTAFPRAAETPILSVAF